MKTSEIAAKRWASPDWLRAKLGTRQWVVARKSRRLIEQGYDLFLSQKRFSALEEEFRAEQNERT